MYHILLFYKIYDIPNYLTRLCQLIEVHEYLGKASDLEKLNKAINNIQNIIHRTYNMICVNSAYT